MQDLQDLYQQVIIDHSKKPRHFGVLPDFNREAEGFNPLCGDQLKLYLKVEHGKVENVSFEGSGCAISTASASMMTDALKGMTESQVDDLFSQFHQMVTSSPELVQGQFDRLEEKLGKLMVFAGVCEFPARVKCASLCWHTLQTALKNSGQVASTE